MKILIADDSELLRKRLRKIILLLSDRIEIKQAATCKEAVSTLQAFNPDVAILDISFPDESGIKVLQKIKKEMPRVVVIMLTNYPTDEFKKNCLEYGADHFFDKSKDFRKIPIILRDLLN